MNVKTFTWTFGDFLGIGSISNSEETYCVERSGNRISVYKKEPHKMEEMRLTLNDFLEKFAMWEIDFELSLLEFYTLYKKLPEKFSFFDNGEKVDCLFLKEDSYSFYYPQRNLFLVYTLNQIPQKHRILLRQ